MQQSGGLVFNIFRVTNALAYSTPRSFMTGAAFSAVGESPASPAGPAAEAVAEYRFENKEGKSAHTPKTASQKRTVKA